MPPSPSRRSSISAAIAASSPEGLSMAINSSRVFSARSRLTITMDSLLTGGDGFELPAHRDLAQTLPGAVYLRHDHVIRLLDVDRIAVGHPAGAARQPE